MNKIVLDIGLLVFFLSIVIFAQEGLMLESVLIKSLLVFVIITIMLSILAITFVKAINKNIHKKEELLNNN